MLTTRFEPASRKNVDRTRDPYNPRKGPLDVGVCPACRKIADGFPSGVVTLHGGFLRTHRDEILAIVRNEERRARETNPLERIMAIREADGSVEVLTTDEKLAQRIGREIRKAYQGTVSFKWSEDANLVRVNWSRGA
ncbi:hypothetical protein K0B90_08935 [bacterium]|nr:hypothetical protein [bacterium]